MLKRKSQIFATCLLLIGAVFMPIYLPVASAELDGDTPPPVTIPNRDNNNPTEAAKKWQEAADRISGSQARLGDELKTLPGPNISFQDLLKLIITWSASLAASVAIFLFIFRSFSAISGTEDSHNQLKSTLVKIIIGLTLIFFSYQLIAFIMGIIWAGS